MKKIVSQDGFDEKKTQLILDSVLSTSHWSHIYKRGFSEEQISQFCSQGLIRSLTADEIQRNWLDSFPRMKGNKSGALLLCFNTNTHSLRADDPPLDDEGKRAKYLYQFGKDTPKGTNTQPWIPEGEPIIATEGFFDGLVATHLIQIPCCAATAPSHILRSKFPSSVRVYISDADVPYHHSKSLLSVVISQCRSRGLKLAHLPRNPDANYAYMGGKIPNNCKWGMEEWAKKWKSERLDSKVELQKVIDSALAPVEYLEQIFIEYRLIGIKYPDHNLILRNAARAIADVSENESDVILLKDLLRENTGAKDKWISSQIEERRINIERRNQGCRDLAEKGRDQSSDVVLPSRPSKRQLQEFIKAKYEVRFNDLSGLVELDGQPMHELDLADSFIADTEAVDVRKESARDAFLYIALSNSYSPVEEYFSALRKRTDLELLPMNEIAAAFGIHPDDSLSTELLARHLVGHVLRGLVPGSEHHQILILVGQQGALKSRTIRAVAPLQSYDSATHIEKLEDREFLSKVNSALVFEIDECERTLRSRTASEFKGFCSRSIDKYVEKYRTYSKEHPRRACLWGTSNERELLNDHTGNRRVWVIDIYRRECKPDWVEQNRDSIWGTVMTWMDWGLTNYLDINSETAKLAAERAHELSLSEPLEETIRNALERKFTYPHEDMAITQSMLLEEQPPIGLGLDLPKIGRDIQMKVTRIVTGSHFTTHQGKYRWEKKKLRHRGLPPRSGYVAVPCTEVVPTESQQVGTPQMPWDCKNLTKVFQPSQAFEDEKGKESIEQKQFM